MQLYLDARRMDFVRKLAISTRTILAFKDVFVFLSIITELFGPAMETQTCRFQTNAHAVNRLVVGILIIIKLDKQTFYTYCGITFRTFQRAMQ